MFKVKVFTVGRCRESWLSLALSEYEKRLRGKLSIEWLLAKDTAQLIEWVQKEPYIALDPKGTLLTSEAWAQKKGQFGSRLVFAIGGAEGLPSQILEQAQFIWSLSPLTFPHQITRLLLVEQLYRAMEMERGSPYHK